MRLAEIAAQGQHHGIGHQVRGQYQVVSSTVAERFPGDVRAGPRCHTGIEDLHEGRDHHRERDDPGADVPMG